MAFTDLPLVAPERKVSGFRPLKVLHHFGKLVEDKEDTEQVFHIIEATKGKRSHAQAHSFIRSPELLDGQLRLKSAPHIRFAGQITGCEGYVESAAIGLVAGMMTAAELAGRDWQPLPATTALGALLSHITGDAEAETFQPMNVNFGLFPPLHDVGKKVRKEAYTGRAKEDLARWISETRERVPA